MNLNHLNHFLKDKFKNRVTPTPSLASKRVNLSRLKQSKEIYKPKVKEKHDRRNTMSSQVSYLSFSSGEFPTISLPPKYEDLTIMNGVPIPAIAAPGKHLYFQFLF